MKRRTARQYLLFPRTKKKESSRGTILHSGSHLASAKHNIQNLSVMEKLTRKEEEIMRKFWSDGPLFVRELQQLYPEPKPHFNTLSTMVRTLESKGYLDHRAYGNTYRYYPVISEDEFRSGTLRGVISRYFHDSYLGAVSALVEEEKISLEELKELIDRIEAGKK